MPKPPQHALAAGISNKPAIARLNKLSVVGEIATGRRRSPGCAAHLIRRH
jgi:hypothetical protein